ncbi:hypothetical protein IPH92_04855 [Candidatus Kaiserbacteria bacterium]|nr:MAG: hypothetical protein IPH92_04855 [Candidatus Kaiserbacteria bacterium]
MTDSKQVPEIKQLPIAEQMERLETWVRGHFKLFNKYRGGKLNGFGQYEFLQPDRAVSPTADLKCYDQLVGDVRVLRNALAVLHRDGCSTAAEALWDALLYSDRYERPYQLPFENEELDELEPMVLLMFEPVKSFQIMKWYPSSWYQLDRLFGEDTDTVLTDESRAVAQMLPSLKKYWEKRRRSRGPSHGDIFEAIGEDILGPFGGMQEWFDVREYGSPVAALYTGDTCSAGMGSTHLYAHDAYNGVAFAYLLRNVHQKDVLERIPRALQGSVATWQFEVYKKTWNGVPRHKVMLIPEDEFACWQGIHKSSVSRSISAGYMAVYNPSKVFETTPGGIARDMKSTLVLDNR